MDNRKQRRAAAKKTARWEREAATKMEAGGRSQRLKERILSAAHEDDAYADPPIPGMRRTTQTPAPPQTDWMPLQAIGGLAAVAFPAYIVAEAALSSTLHPLHWLVAVVGGLLGYVGGLLLYRRRGY